MTMNDMLSGITEFTQSLPFIIFFLFLVLLVTMTTNAKVANGFLTLTLLSMIVVNADKFKSLLGGIKF